MKKHFKLLVTGILFLLVQNCLSAQVNVPDANFRYQLSKNYGITFDGNNNITNPDVAEKITKIIVSRDYLSQGTGITDISGIEAFTGLLEFSCQWNSISNLDLSKNIKLEKLYCSFNKIITLNVSSCLNLKELACQNNKLVTLDVSLNSALSFLECSQNSVSNLNLSSNIQLKWLRCYGNSIDSLNIKGIITLQTLDCSFNKLKSLDVSSNTNLGTLKCGENLLTELNLSNNIKLNDLLCNNNQLKTLDISLNKNLEFLNINGNFTPFVLKVRNGLFPTPNLKFTDTSPASDKEVQIIIPDENFRKTLNTNYGIIFNGDNKVINPEVAGTIKIMNLNSKNIVDISGLNAFTSLEELFCNNNQISNLDISANILLNKLDCSNNQISDLDISTNKLITDLNISGNPTPFLLGVNKLPFPSNNVLTFLDTEPSSLKTIQYHIPDIYFRRILRSDYGITFEGDKVTNPAIAAEVKKLHLSYLRPGEDINDLAGIEAFSGLTFLDCGYNRLTSLNITFNNDLKELICASNQLKSLDISKNVKLTSIDCDDNQITDLDVSANNLVEILDCDYNQLTSIDVSLNKMLTKFWCVGNKILNLDISNNTKLKELLCYYNQLTSIDVSSNTDLQNFQCGYNQITNLDVSTNTSLTYLAIVGNPTPFTLKAWVLPYPQPWFSLYDTNPESIKNLVPVSVNHNSSNPETFSLSQNYPNPFNPTTKINYQLKSSSQVSLKIYDLLGREIKTIVNQFKPAGDYQVDFNGSEFPSGVYIYKLQAGSFTEMKKMMLVK